MEKKKRNLKPVAETVRKFEQLQRNAPPALQRFLKTQPNIMLEGQGGRLKAHIDMDEYYFDQYSQQQIVAVLKKHQKSDTTQSYMRDLVTRDLNEALIRLLSEGHITLKP